MTIALFFIAPSAAAPDDRMQRVCLALIAGVVITDLVTVLRGGVVPRSRCAIGAKATAFAVTSPGAVISVTPAARAPAVLTVRTGSQRT